MPVGDLCTQYTVAVWWSLVGLGCLCCPNLTTGTPPSSRTRLRKSGTTPSQAEGGWVASSQRTSVTACEKKGCDAKKKVVWRSGSLLVFRFTKSPHHAVVLRNCIPPEYGVTVRRWWRRRGRDWVHPPVRVFFVLPPFFCIFDGELYLRSFLLFWSISRREANDKSPRVLVCVTRSLVSTFSTRRRFLLSVPRLSRRFSFCRRRPLQIGD